MPIADFNRKSLITIHYSAERWPVNFEHSTGKCQTSQGFSLAEIAGGKAGDLLEIFRWASRSFYRRVRRSAMFTRSLRASSKASALVLSMA